MDRQPASDKTPVLWHGYEVIAKGANRVCVIDPENTSRCLKFDLPAQEAKGGRANRWRRFRGEVFPKLALNHIEWRAYQKCLSIAGQSLHNYVATCFGLRHTPHGKALSSEIVLNSDGSIAKPIYTYFDQPTSIDYLDLLDALDELQHFLLRHKIPLFDLNSGNLLVLHCATGRIRVKCIDVKSVGQNKELIPFSRWLVGAMRSKIKRRIERLKQLITIKMAQKSPENA
ncbi:YrbL family protein [Simiduia aestuariiviva]|uniref:PhoP regulatory network protein YrbL n=1 Tax=Simiduia aestuariiviva TaxID=1510459 RepID=A0A839UTY4_9GAMM|nr:YrbL family protein [Simiduia aestuariiviva]MBB3169889.1 hypothetical protein [Simiduia aestuariiviva]